MIGKKKKCQTYCFDARVALRSSRALAVTKYYKTDTRRARCINTAVRSSTRVHTHGNRDESPGRQEFLGKITGLLASSCARMYEVRQ